MPIIPIIITGISSNVVQNGFIFSAEPIIPKLNKIPPVRGLKRIFSSKPLVEVTSSILKLTLITAVILIIIKSELSTIITLSTPPLSLVFTFVHKIIIKIMVGVIIIMSFIAILDLLYKKYDHKKGLRMSKQEVKDEMKQTEGNPEVKAKLRKVRTDITNLNINDAIKTADVVISNPEHFAIALQYDMEAMPAPKGRDHMAQK